MWLSSISKLIPLIKLLHQIASAMKMWGWSCHSTSFNINRHLGFVIFYSILRLIWNYFSTAANLAEYLVQLLIELPRVPVSYSYSWETALGLPSICIRAIYVEPRPQKWHEAVFISSASSPALFSKTPDTEEKAQKRGWHAKLRALTFWPQQIFFHSWLLSRTPSRCVSWWMMPGDTLSETASSLVEAYPNYSSTRRRHRVQVFREQSLFSNLITFSLHMTLKTNQHQCFITKSFQMLQGSNQSKCNSRSCQRICSCVFTDNMGGYMKNRMRRGPGLLHFVLTVVRAIPHTNSNAQGNTLVRLTRYTI